jgi:hypothetical protein
LILTKNKECVKKIDIQNSLNRKEVLCIMKDRRKKGKSEVRNMLTCQEAEKMVMPYIDEMLGEEELDEFLEHIEGCEACREELEIYYTVSVGLRQLDAGTGVFDIAGALEESMDLAWLKVRAARLRRVICYAVGTLCATGVLTTMILQLRIWLQTGLLG